jgi:hypothetical protein
MLEELAGPLIVDEDQVGEIMAGLSPEQLLITGLPVWWLKITANHPANSCLDSALILREAFAVFGEVAEPKCVELHALDTVCGREYRFGTPNPCFEGTRLVGHVGLWLPKVSTFVDQTAQQFPPLRAHCWLPVITHSTPGTAWRYAELAIRRGPLELTYRPVRDEHNNAVITDPSVRAASTQHHRRAGINLASSMVDLLRRDHYRDTALASPYSRLHHLLRAVGDAPATIDTNRNLRFMMPGTEGLYLDQLPR